MAILNAPMSFIAFSVLRFFQLVLALTVCGLYGVDLTNARNAGSHADGRWVCIIAPPILAVIDSDLPGSGIRRGRRDPLSGHSCCLYGPSGDEEVSSAVHLG